MDTARLEEKPAIVQAFSMDTARLEEKPAIVQEFPTKLALTPYMGEKNCTFAGIYHGKLVNTKKTALLQEFFAASSSKC